MHKFLMACGLAIAASALAQDTVYVRISKQPLAGANGSVDAPFHVLDSAFTRVDTGGTIIMLGGLGADSAARYDIDFAGTAPVTITALTDTAGRYSKDRPYLVGTATEPALIISRPNVTVKGLLLEMPPGGSSPALSVEEDNAVIEANLFRPTQSTGLENVSAIRIEGSTPQHVRVVNNIVWGFGNAIELADANSAEIRILYNTFIDEPTLQIHGKATGIKSAGASAAGLKAVVSSNYFSGMQTPYHSSLSGAQLTLRRNGYPIPSVEVQGLPKVNFQGMPGDTLLDMAAALPAVNLHAPAFMDTLLFGHTTKSGSPFNCNTNKECTSLYAAGETDSALGPPPERDFFGRRRVNRPEVGAFEFEKIDANKVVSWLKLSVHNTDSFGRLEYVISSLNFDPADADSVKVWWAKSDALDIGSPAVVGSAVRPAASLFDGPIRDTADGLEENVVYYFRAAFYRGQNKGHAPTDSLSTGTLLSSEPCNFEYSDTRCPSGSGFFKANDTYSGWIRSHVVLTSKASQGAEVSPPEFEDAAVLQAGQPKLTLLPGIPGFSLAVNEDSLGGSAQTFTLVVEMDTPAIDSALSAESADLFLLSDLDNPLPSLVTSWSSSDVNGKTIITVEGNRKGRLSFAFGSLKAGLAPGGLKVPATGQVVDFAAGGDSVVQINFDGSAFNTANPLILAGIVPAGAYMGGAVLETNKDRRYPLKTFVLATGMAGLPDSLKRERLYAYYQRMRRGPATASAGVRPAFLLNDIGKEQFFDVLVDGDLTLTGQDGKVPPSSVTFSLPGDYSDARKSRSLEVVFAVFDGASVSYQRAFVRTRFTSLHTDETRNFTQKREWHLFSLPWEETGATNLAHVVGGDNWDGAKYEILRYKGSGEGAQGYEVYNGGDPGQIPFHSGHAIWAGGIDPFKPKPVDGMSLDFQPHSLNLNLGLWNDIGLPFNFPMLWKDVLDASGVTSATLPVYRYVLIGDTLGSWQPVAPSDTVRPWEGLTVRPVTATVLKFPVVDVNRTLNVAAKRSAGAMWSARVMASNSSAAMVLDIGKGPREDRMPRAPLVPGQNFLVSLKSPSSDEPLSLHMQQGDRPEGYWSLQSRMLDGAEGIRLALDRTRGSAVPIHLVEAMEGGVQTLTAEGEVMLSAQDIEKKEYYLVAGDAEYLHEVLNSLNPSGLLKLTGFPNPFRSDLRVRYVLPASVRNAEYRVSLFNAHGRVVWSRLIRGGNELDFRWDGRISGGSPLPAGAYHLKVVADALDTGKRFSAVRRLLKL